MTLVMTRSATGGRTVVAAVATLFPGLGSTALLVADTALIIGLGLGTSTGAVASTPISTILPGGIVPRLHATAGPPPQVPIVDVADMSDTPGGSPSVTTTPAAEAGPRF